MLSKFHAMKSTYAQPVLPQSLSKSEVLEFVHRGYETVLAGSETMENHTPPDSQVVHILIPALAAENMNVKSS